MNKIILSAFLGLTVFGNISFAQQLPVTQQNYFNNFSLQPAYTGYKEGLYAFASYRTNMLGYSSTPNTVAANLSYRNSDKHGFGASLMTDQVGLIRNNMFNVSYAYRLKVSATGTLSAGFSAGIAENRLDFAAVSIEDQSDLGNLSNNGKLMYNAGFGLAYSTPKLTLGFGLPMLYSSRATYTYNATDFTYGLQPTYTVNAAYKIKVKSKIELVPSIIVRGQQAQDMLNDYILTMNYNGKFSISSGYRSSGIVPVVLKVDLKRNLTVYYGQELAIGTLANASKGGFELGIGYKFPLKNGREAKLQREREALERDSLNQALNALNDSLKIKMDALIQMDSVKQNNDELNEDIKQLRDDLKKAALEKQRLEASKEEAATPVREVLVGKNSKKSETKTIDEAGVAIDQDAGYYLIVQSSVNREALEKDLIEWNEKEKETFIIKPGKSKWYMIAVFKFEDRKESLKALKEFRTKYPRAWIKKIP